MTPRIIRLVTQPDGSEKFVGDPVLYRRMIADVVAQGPLVMVGHGEYADRYFGVDEVVDENQT